MSNAAATMVGQGLGARKPERAERAVWRAGIYNLIFLSTVGALFVGAAGPIASLSTHEPPVAQVATRCLRVVALGLPLYAYGMVLGQSFNGAGDTWTPTWLNFVCFWVLEIPLAWLLADHVGWGPMGVFIAITAAFSVIAIASAVLFKQGRWKLRKV